MVMLQVKTITKSGNVLDFDVVVLTHFQEKHPLEKIVHMFPLWENFSAFIGIFFKTLLLTIQVGLLLPRKCLRAACHPYPNPTRQISSCTSRPAARDCCSSASFLACSAARRLAWNACNLKGRQLISAHVFWWMLGNFKSKMEGCTYKNGLLQEVLMTFDPVNIDTSPVEKAGFMLEKPQKLGQTLPPRASAHASCSTKNNLPGHHLNHRNDSTKSGAELQNLDIQKSPSSISYPVEGKKGISSSLMWSHRDNPIPKLFVKLPFFIFFRWDRVPWFSCLLQSHYSLHQHQWLNHSLNLAGEEGSLQISNMTHKGCKIWLEGHSQNFGPRYSASLRCARFGRWAIVPGVNM